jgi:uncharacterized protein YaeQ
MALTATLHDFDVTLSHVDRDLHLRLPIRTARHPSETLDRVWLRVLAYCWLWEERIAFGPGLSDPDAPDLFADDLTGEKTLWIRVGRPDPVRLRREADRAPRAKVGVLLDAPARLDAFLEAARQGPLGRLREAVFAAVEPSLLTGLAAVEERRTRCGITIVGDHLYVERGGTTLDGPLSRGSLA